MDRDVPYTGLAAPPHTYREWLDCFSYVKVHPMDDTGLRLLRKGTLACDPNILDKFLLRVDETVGEVLNHCISTFLSRVGQAFEEADIDSVEILAIRFWEHAAECFFFEDLDCIPGQRRRQFREGYVGQLDKFWGRFLAQLDQESEECRNLALDELVFRLRRQGPERVKKGMQG